MKKIISFFIVIALALTMCACVSGVSVPYYLLKIDNETPRVLQKYSGIKETLIYYKDGEESFSYSTYIEYSENAEYGYNIFESFDGYTFYGYEGELYSVSDGKTYAVIQADNKNYYEFRIIPKRRTRAEQKFLIMPKCPLTMLRDFQNTESKKGTK